MTDTEGAGREAAEKLPLVRHCQPEVMLRFGIFTISNKFMELEMIAIFINAAARDISYVDYFDHLDIKTIVADGGVINIAKIWPDRTVLYIDDISLMKSREYWFTIDGIAPPIAGNGLVVGPDIAPHLDEDFGY